MIRPINFYADVAPFILYHHERYDGYGYPAKLKGDAIPIESRIIAVAEAFDAMVSETSYKVPLSFDAAIEELQRNAALNLISGLSMSSSVISSPNIYSSPLSISLSIMAATDSSPCNFSELRAVFPHTRMLLHSLLSGHDQSETSRLIRQTGRRHPASRGKGVFSRR